MNTKNALFAAQNKSKRMAGKTAGSVTNATAAKKASAVEKASIRKSCGITIPKASRLPHNLPLRTNAAAKPFIAT